MGFIINKLSKIYIAPCDWALGDNEMKMRICFGTTFIVLLLLLVPGINAVEIQTIEKASALSYYSYEEIKNMDAEDLVVFINELSKIFPGVFEKIQQMLQEIETTPVSSMMEKELVTATFSEDLTSHPINNNQTFLEKIFWKIFTYRVFRLYISTCIYLFYQSKLTLLRTMTWAIKLFRLVKIGILLGIVDPSSQDSPEPTASYDMM